MIFVCLSISQKRPEKWVKKSSRKIFERAALEELSYFISNGPILLVWVTDRKFELEGLNQKKFTVKPRANVYSNLDKAKKSVVLLIRFVDKVYQLLIINNRLQALKCSN